MHLTVSELISLHPSVRALIIRIFKMKIKKNLFWIGFAYPYAHDFLFTIILGFAYVCPYVSLFLL